MTVDQSQRSVLFRLPLEVRLEIYSYLIRETILHVEPLRAYYIDHQSDIARFQVKTAGLLLEAEDRQYIEHLEKLRTERRIDQRRPPVDGVVRSLQLSSSTGYRALFRLYQCVSLKSFTAASACPPGVLDHVDCGKIKDPFTHAIRRTCRQAYAESAVLSKMIMSQTALQFTSLQDLSAFSMLLSDDARESIRHLRINLNSPPPSHHSPEWLYFCNVFATPWDRRSLQSYCEGSNYPNHKAEIRFYYNRSPWDLSDDDDKALASSWVVANVGFNYTVLNTSWGMKCELSDLKARAPISVRFAIPQFLVTREDGEIDFETEDVWDDETQDVIQPGDELHIRWAERCLIDQFAIEDMIVSKKATLACKDSTRQKELCRTYDEKFHRYWHQGPFEQNHTSWGWCSPLQRCRHFESFDIDFYDENGPRSTTALEIIRDGLKEHLSLDIGPHPCLYFKD